MRLQGRSIGSGKVAGEALVTTMNVSFFGGIDPETGIVVERGHELEGQCIAGKIFIFPTGIGSTVGSYKLENPLWRSSIPNVNRSLQLAVSYPASPA
jgi:predicted aconitase with swiveling domain